MKKNGFKRLINTIKNNWRVAVVVTVMFGISGYILAGYGLRKHFITSTEVYIESLDGTSASEKAAMAALLFTSPRMYDAVNEHLKTSLSYAELDEITNVWQKNGTQIIRAEFDCRTSVESYKIAELFLSLMQNVLDDYDGANAKVQTVSSPVEPQYPSYPDEILFAVLGAIVGFLLSCIGIFVIWKLDNTITSADNIAEEYNVPVLGELTDLDNEIDYLGR